MIKINLIQIIAFSLVFVFISCEKDVNIELNKEYPGVDPALWTYFEKFEKEAAKRGVEIDLNASRITGSIEKIHAHGTIGLCNHRVDEPNHVIIDAGFWTTSSEMSREMFVFHELGHCYLSRGHNDEMKKDGTCASIMRSGNGGCIDFYSNSSKAAYLEYV